MNSLLPHLATPESVLPMHALARLPSELLLRIFEVGIDYLEHDESDFPETRSSHGHLLYCALVHSTWSCPAQQVLYCTLIMRNRSSVEKWLDSCTTKRGIGSNSLSIAGYGPSPDRVTASQIESVIPLTRGLRRFSLRHPERVDIAVITSTTLSSSFFFSPHPPSALR